MSKQFTPKSVFRILKFITLWQCLVVGVAMDPQSYMRKIIYIHFLGHCCPSEVLYLNSREHCSPNCIFSAVFPFYDEGVFSLDCLCRFLPLLMGTLTHSKYYCYSILSLLHCAYFPCFFSSLFLVFFVAENWNGTTALESLGVSLGIFTGCLVSVSCRHWWMWFSNIVYVCFSVQNYSHWIRNLMQRPLYKI